MNHCKDLKSITHVKPISSIRSLVGILNTTEEILDHIIDTKAKFHNKFLNEDNREVSSIREPLSFFLRALNKYFFENTIFPPYLLGGIKGRSYIDNARQHAKKRILINEDITKFYPSISQELVQDTFQYFFNLPNSIAVLIADLCCVNGFLATGSPISGNIANLILFDVEPDVVSQLQAKGFLYTRFVDDITVSSPKQMSKEDITSVKILIYSMLTSKGFKINRQKSQIVTPANSMRVHKIIVNHANIQPSQKNIQSMRSDLHHFEILCTQENVKILDILTRYKSIEGKINSLKSTGLSQKKYILFKKKLTDALCLINSKQVTKYIRNIRRIKKDKEYHSFTRKLALLSKISPEIKKIISEEKKRYTSKKQRLLSAK